ncbi:uncharacterized protein LOC121388783 [Gigantopelta aegis]|uniref:uncharacterized protein LOC121388783 n=1 Tax=Gigantopelta aegis TaxID=1735272 RepID=UPI001B88A360|nr:uncharacterized protein LOC121388783 [Gigantopelta aegis]
MASAPRDSIACGICMDRFRDPRSLLCGHSFCHQCLEDHVFSTVTWCCFRCPICRKANYFDNTKSLAEQFGLNYSLIQISERITQQQMAPVVTGSSNVVVAGGNIVDSKVNITITNVYGIDTPKAKLKKSLDQLETSFQSMEVKLQYQRQQELVNLDLNVSQIKHDIDASAEKLIELYKASDSDHKNVEKFTEEICGGRESQHIQLSKLHETARTKIDEQFNEERMVLVEPRQLLQDNLLVKNSLTDLEIEKNTERIDNANKILTDYLAQNQTKPTQTRITFTKSACEGDAICPNIGILSWTDGRTEMKGETICPDIGILCLTDGQTDMEMKQDTEDRQETGHKNQESVYLKLLKVINTRYDPNTTELTPLLTSIDVIVVYESLKVLVADCRNLCIKCYNYDDGMLYCSYKTSDAPRGLAKLQDCRVVVTLPHERQIVFFTVTDVITVTNTLNMEKGYFNITQLHDSHLAATVWLSKPGCVDILDLKGHVMRSISNLTAKPWYVTVLGINLFVVSGVNTVTCMTSSGDINWVTSPNTKPRFAWGIACDRSGFVYVVDRDSNTVIQLSPSGEYLCDVLTGHDKISVPRALCFNRDLLYMTQDNGEIKIFIAKQN